MNLGILLNVIKIAKIEDCTEAIWHLWIWGIKADAEYLFIFCFGCLIDDQKSISALLFGIIYNLIVNSQHNLQIFLYRNKCHFKSWTNQKLILFISKNTFKTLWLTSKPKKILPTDLNKCSCLLWLFWQIIFPLGIDTVISIL